MSQRLLVHLMNFACCLFFSTALFAAQLTGTVTNATTGKPAAGDQVTLLSLSGGMQETSSATTDAQGKFTLEEPDESVEHLIRVNHDGAFYFKAAPVGTTNSAVNVYDVAAKVDNILQQGRVFQMQTANGLLEVSEKYILRNESAPRARAWATILLKSNCLPAHNSLTQWQQVPEACPSPLCRCLSKAEKTITECLILFAPVRRNSVSITKFLTPDALTLL